MTEAGPPEKRAVDRHFISRSGQVKFLGSYVKAHLYTDDIFIHKIPPDVLKIVL